MIREQKRHEGRLRVAVTGEYRFLDKDEWTVCRLVDISADGMALDGKTSFYAGDKLEVRFPLEKRMIVLTLEITHLLGKKAGGRIIKIDETDRNIIQEVLNRELLSGNTFLK